MTKKQKITYYILTVVVSILFIAAATSKLLSQPEAIAGFTIAGLPLWFFYFIGVVELLGVIGLWIKKTAVWAAAGLSIIMIGAVVVTAEFVSVAEAILPLIVGIILVVLIYLRKKEEKTK